MDVSLDFSDAKMPRSQGSDPQALDSRSKEETEGRGDLGSSMVERKDGRDQGIVRCHLRHSEDQCKKEV
jgi:hypothetical protein